MDGLIAKYRAELDAIAVAQKAIVDAKYRKGQIESDIIAEMIRDNIDTVPYDSETDLMLCQKTVAIDDLRFRAATDPMRTVKYLSMAKMVRGVSKSKEIS